MQTSETKKKIDYDFLAQRVVRAATEKNAGFLTKKQWGAMSEKKGGGRIPFYPALFRSESEFDNMPDRHRDTRPTVVLGPTWDSEFRATEHLAKDRLAYVHGNALEPTLNGCVRAYLFVGVKYETAKVLIRDFPYSSLALAGTAVELVRQSAPLGVIADALRDSCDGDPYLYQIGELGPAGAVLFSLACDGESPQLIPDPLYHLRQEFYRPGFYQFGHISMCWCIRECVERLFAEASGRVCRNWADSTQEEYAEYVTWVIENWQSKTADKVRARQTFWETVTWGQVVNVLVDIHRVSEYRQASMMALEYEERERNNRAAVMQVFTSFDPTDRPSRLFPSADDWGMC